MPKLTQAQINSLLAIAREQGLDESEIDALEETLLRRSADLNMAQRTELLFQSLPEDQQRSVQQLQDALGTVGRSVLSRGAAELDKLSDDEWTELVEDAASA